MGAKKWGEGANTKLHLICMKIGGKYHFGVLISVIEIIFDIKHIKQYCQGPNVISFLNLFTPTRLFENENDNVYLFELLF